MTKHIIPFTYQPKIEAVKDGRCTQTIRHLGKIPRKSGDTALLHGWEGKPYYSPWSWRKDVAILSVQNINVVREGFTSCLPIDNREPPNIYNNSYWLYTWDELDWLAKLDFINPPTGVELGRVLLSKNKEIRKNGFMPAQIIRWLP